MGAAERANRRSSAQPKTLCLIPRALAPRLEDELQSHFARDSSIEVLVERRRGDRRRAKERRASRPVTGDEPSDANVEPDGESDRRRIHNRGGRRVGDRRATLVPVKGPADLPSRAQRHARRIVFAQRLITTAEQLEDLETARMITRVQSGDESAFVDMYKRYFQRIYTYLRVALDDPHEAEDATQQVYLRVLEALPDYQLSGAPFRSWLFRIVRNHTINHLMKHSRIEAEDPLSVDQRREGSIGLGSIESHLGQMGALDWISDEDLMRFIERMPSGQRQVLVLRFVMDLSCTEIAGVLGRSPGAVRQLQQRGLDFLRERLTAVGRQPRAPSSPMHMRALLREAVVPRYRRRALVA